MSVEKNNVQEIITHTVDTLPQVYRGQLEAIYEKENVNMKDFVIGALVGGVSGIYYSNINNKWLNDLIRKDYLIDLCLEYRKIMENGL